MTNKQATYYNCGTLGTNRGEDLFMFTCWNEHHTGCGCHSVYANELQNNIAALERMGYVVENLDRPSRS